MRKHGAALAAERKVELILALLMNMLLYHCVACTAVSAVYASGWRDHYLWMLWLVLPLFFLAYVRYYVKSFVVFLLLHIMMPLGCFLLGRDMREAGSCNMCDDYVSALCRNGDKREVEG